MKKPILVANWKNHPGSLPEAQSLLKELNKKKLLYKKLSLFVAPPLAFLESTAKTVKSFGHLASQDYFPQEKGSFTGAVSPEILKSFGVKLVILGHSERRALGETSEEVSFKVKSSLKAGLLPLVCVGEKERDHEGEHFEKLRDEIKTSLSGLKKSDLEKLLIAYEPIWAIGKSAKEAIDPSELAQTVLFIRKVLSDLFGREAAESAAILYGGSVEAGNVRALMGDTGVRGFLVGHASLSSHHFAEIAESLITKI
jgi:triosephosphate isomerase (TIM)